MMVVKEKSFVFGRQVVVLAGKSLGVQRGVHFLEQLFNGLRAYNRKRESWSCDSFQKFLFPFLLYTGFSH